jgi:predicted metalloprotease with PDZ domain
MPARGSQKSSNQAAIRFTVRPLDLPLHEVEVEMSLPAEAVKSGAVAALPSWTPGSYLVRDYARFLDRVVLRDSRGNAIPIAKLDKQRWSIPALEAGGTLSYRLYCNDLTVRTNHADAVHAHLVGSASFLYLEGQQNRSCEVRFVGWPQDWRVATGLKKQGVTFLAKDHDELVDSPFELGTFRLHEWTCGKAAFEFAITGEHCGDESRILEGTKRIVEVCGKMFGGFPFDRYVFLLTFSPGARGGLEHRDSTSLLADPFGLDKPDGYYDLFTLIAHEFFHAWNVKRLRASELGPFDYSKENMTKLLWFHEGFTSFIQYSLVLKAGVAPWSWVARKLASTWTDNTTRHGRHEQNLEESSFDAWIRFYKPTEFSTNSTVSYYEKGSLIAWMMDAKFRLATGGKSGVDDYFRLLWKKFGDGHITDADLKEAYRTLSGEDPGPFWQRYIAGVAEPDAEPIERAYGLKLARLAPWEALTAEDAKDPETLARARVYTGLSFLGESASILNVVPGSPAAKAGMAYNEEVLAVNGWRTHSAMEITRRLGDRKIGDTVEVITTDRGRVKRCRLVVEENPQRITRIVPQPKASTAQKNAFKDWTGQPFPVVKSRM